MSNTNGLDTSVNLQSLSFKTGEQLFICKQSALLGARCNSIKKYEIKLVLLICFCKQHVYLWLKCRNVLLLKIV